MTSRRRRPRARTSITTVLVLLGIALGAAVLRGGWTADPGADAAPGSVPTASVTASAEVRVPAPVATGPSRASSPTAAAAAAADAARSQLAALPVKGKAPATGYDRVDDFGTAWLDVDRNGCDTRNDVLARDLTGVVRRGPCTVTAGVLVSPYTGATIDFVRGQQTSTLVQIDHVVALENAWVTGAQQLPQDRREALANDPDNLFAVDQHSNAQKRSGDAATWLPAAKAFRCTYVEHQITVKARYGLWVAPAERDAMVRVLGSC